MLHLQRLKDAKQWLGKDVPFKSVSSVADLKRLMEYADTNRQCEAKLLELLNMRVRASLTVPGWRCLRCDALMLVSWNGCAPCIQPPCSARIAAVAMSSMAALLLASAVP